MKCPLTGKPCLTPKEIYITELRTDGVHHLFMCKKCGEQYIKNLKDVNVTTKSMEVFSTGNDISYTEKVLEDPKPVLSPESNNKKAPKTHKINTIKTIEAKLQDAIDNEKYEIAVELRNKLNKLKNNEEI